MNGRDEETKRAGQAHIGKEEMAAYVNGGMSGPERERTEAHLFACDDCLALYMDALEAELPLEGEIARPAGAGSGTASLELPDMDEAAIRVIRLLEQESGGRNRRQAASITDLPGQSGRSGVRPSSLSKERRRNDWLRRPGTHFAAAAAVTLLLVGTGALGGLSERLAGFERQAAAPLFEQPDEQEARGEAWSDKMLDRTAAWLDGIEAERFQ